MPTPAPRPPAPAFRHILLLRTDHLGDMMLSLPMASAIKAALPECRVSVLASRANAAAAQHHPHVDHVEIDTQESKGSNLHGVVELARRLHGLGCDAAIIVHAKPRLAVAAWMARIPVRVGTAYRAYSFLFNRRMHQHRRGGPAKHEAQLNVEMLETLGISTAQAPRALWQINASDANFVTDLLVRHGLKAQGFVVLHPGSSHSAMNWTPPLYGQLGRILAGNGQRVVVTGGPDEIELTRTVTADIGTAAVDLGGKVTLGQLAALLSQATAYVGCSTGPTHLAAAVGTPVIGLYPPLRSTLPTRWRPLGDSVTIFQPTVGQVCPKCLLDQCPFFQCMDKHIAVDAVARAVRDVAISRQAPTQASP